MTFFEGMENNSVETFSKCRMPNNKMVKEEMSGRLTAAHIHAGALFYASKIME
ncbi:hypothetical protein TWF281_009348 [Arthrobotrys megalospora]